MDKIYYALAGKELEIEEIAKSVGPGWRPMVTLLCQLCLAYGVEVAQVKEKFGGLRFYTGPADPNLADFIMEVEEHSYEICEKCGNPGRPREGRWIKTLCDDCAQEAGIQIRSWNPDD